MKCADFANYARVPTAADIAALHDLGVTRVIIGSSFGTVWHDQVDACEAAGFEVQNYCFPQHVSFNKPYWLDVEREDNHISTKDEVRAICASTEPPIGIYTSASMWAALMADWDIVAEFPWLKLWVANYGPLPRPFTPFGGWLKADMTQYAGTVDIGTGFEVDLSEYEGGRMYTDAEIDAKVGAALDLGVRNQQNISDLANGQDALPSLKGQLRYLWALAGKAWPF